MARPRSTGLNIVSRKRPDGQTYEDFYHRASGRKLGSSVDMPIERAIAAAAEADGIRPSFTIPQTFAQLCESYLGSGQFRALAPRSQTLNRLYVDKLRDRFGTVRLEGMTRPVVVRYRERLTVAEQPWLAYHLLSKLRLVMQHGCDIGAVKGANPAAKPGGVRAAKRSRIWSPAQTDRMLTAAGTPRIKLACALLLYTAQRPGDVLAMTTGHVHDRWDERAGRKRLALQLRQEKTGELVEVPCHQALEALLRERLAERIDSLLLVPSPTGLPWLYRNFSRAWDRTRGRADYRLARQMLRQGASHDQVRAEMLKGLQRRDMRRTAMVRMAEAGATTVQIAAVSGHTIDQTSRILDTYIPRRTEVARGAIEAWERGAPAQVAFLPQSAVAKPPTLRNGGKKAATKARK